MENEVLVNNLYPSVDVSTLCDTFRQFGRIISAGVEVDSSMSSSCNGYVQFDNYKSACISASRLNGNKHLGNPLHVSMRNVNENFTKIFVKNINRQWDECDLLKAFREFGTIKKATVAENDGIQSGYGFVEFLSHESAKKAVKAMNEKTIADHKLIVQRCMNKSELAYYQQNSLEYAKSVLEKSIQRNNLHVKNLPHDVTDMELRMLFERFGAIQSIKVAKDESLQSKGFGFGCFKSVDAAKKACMRMNDYRYKDKIIKVNFKEDREARSHYLYLKNMEKMKEATRYHSKSEKYASTGTLQFTPHPLFSYSAKSNH